MRAIVTPNNVFTFHGETFRCAIGRGGVKPDKHEGDGGTPAGALPLRRVLYRPDRGPAPHSVVPVQALKPTDGWCDEPGDSRYNRPVTLPITVSAEQLWREDGVYDIIGILGWNDAPIRPGRGSAIFLHDATIDYAPTDGCVALAPADLRRVLALGLTEIIVRA